MTAPRLQNSAPAGPQQRRAERRMPRQGPPRWGTMEGGGKGRLSRCAGTPSRLGTPSSLGKASRVAGGPGCHHLQGHVACAGHHRRAPHVGRAARGWSRAGLRGAGPDPAGGSPRPSPLTTWRPRGMGVPDASARQWPFDASVRPPPTRPRSLARAPRAPTDTGTEGRGGSRGFGVLARAPHSSTPRPPRTLLSQLLPLSRTAPSPPAGVYRDSGRRRLFNPTTKMAAGPEPRPQPVLRVGGLHAGASGSGASRTIIPRRLCALANRLQDLAPTGGPR